MGLKNFQYNKIIREYDARQLRNKHLLDQKYAKLSQELPEFEELQIQISSCYAQCAKSAVLGEDELLAENRQKIKKLNVRKKQMLWENGYPENYLEPSYICIDCKDTGYTADGEKCHCFKQAAADLLYSQSNIKTVIQKENFAAFSFDYYSDDYVEETTGLTPYQNIRKVTSYLKQFINGFDDQYDNVLLYGNTGVGKTFLTNCIAKELLDKAHTVIYLTAFQFFDILEKNKFSKSEDTYEVEEQFNGILQCDLLIIDDLGTELNNTFISSQLYLCMNERHLCRKSTIISTNLSLDDLNTRYSERIFSRIISNYTLLKIIGEDIRLKKAFTS